MKYLICALTLSCYGFSAAPKNALESRLKKQYESAAHWGGEVSGEESPERIAEINRGAKNDCAAARKTVDAALGAKRRSVPESALVIQIADICHLHWAEKTDWKAKLAPLCKQTKAYFKSLSPEKNPDGQSAYGSLCP